VERWPYRVAAAFALCALVLPSRWWLWAVAACMAVSVAVAVVHVGVEQGRWPSPLPECAAPNFGGGTIAERLARMPARPAKPCDEPTFLVPFIPVSMAGMNLLLALAFGSFLAISLTRTPRSRP
jgi:disulfide bond formation protein DsbB